MAISKKKAPTKKAGSNARRSALKKDSDWLGSGLDSPDTPAFKAKVQKLLRLKKQGKFPFRRLTPREEKELLDRMKREIDRDQLEAECRELIRLGKEGKLIPAEKVLRDLYKTEVKRKKKPA